MALHVTDMGRFVSLKLTRVAAERLLRVELLLFQFAGVSCGLSTPNQPMTTTIRIAKEQSPTSVLLRLALLIDLCCVKPQWWHQPRLQKTLPSTGGSSRSRFKGSHGVRCLDHGPFLSLRCSGVCDQSIFVDPHQVTNGTCTYYRSIF